MRWVVDASSVVAYLLGEGSDAERGGLLGDVCTTYDALYVTLAEALDATLLTRDARLAHGVEGLVDVVVSG